MVRPSTPNHVYHLLAVKSVVLETHDTRSYVLSVPGDLAGVFVYRPGQFCTFRVHVGDETHLRCYSMSSAPAVDQDLTVTVKRVVDGVVSNWIHDHVVEGSFLELTRPAGVFCVEEGTAPVLAFCGGSGVTPVMSITKSVLATTDRRVRWLYANRDERSIIFDEQLRALSADHPGRLMVEHHLDATAGFLEEADIRNFVAADWDAEFSICGPAPFMDLVESTLRASGVDADRIALERFVNSAQQPETDASADSDGHMPGEVTLILKGKRNTIAYRPGDTILETARRAALDPPYSCEMGNCATCMALVLEGSASMRANNVLTAEEVSEGWILTCQSYPEGDVFTVEYETY